MRITSGSYYNNIYGENNKLNRQLFDVNKQISSGIKIQYAHENPGIFIDTLRLDDEVTTLTQIKSSVQSAYKVSTQTDTTIGEIVKTLESMKVKMVNAANDYHSNTSLQAIAKELRGLQNHLVTLANTSIGGQYLFSGTAVSIKPIGSDQSYQGNGQDLDAFMGSGVKQKYNISGEQLFLGEETKINRTVTTNMPQLSLTDLYPDIMNDPGMKRSMSSETYISTGSTIRDLMGDTDADPTNDAWQSHFYLQGTKSDGERFKQKITLPMDATVDDLLREISDAYGTNQVNVNLNINGQIEITDKLSGSSKLDFHMIGAVDFTGGTAADVSNIDDLQPANNATISTTDFDEIIDPAAAKTLYVKEFTRSGFNPSDPTHTIEGIDYDRTVFEQNGARLLSNVSQTDNTTHAFATPSTKLVDTAGVSTLDGKQMVVAGKDIYGTPFTAQIDFSSAGSTFSINAGASYDIFTATAPRAAVPADEMTYQQFMDVVNIAMSGTTPAGNTQTDYDNAITASNALSSTSLDHAGRLVFEDKNSPTTSAQLSLYDSTSSNYGATDGVMLTFQANNALTIRDPKTDFFAQIEQTIRSVEEGKTRADGTSTTDQRNVGIQNSIQMIDDLSDHVSRLQTEAGSYSQVLSATSDRTDMLIISTKRLQSDVIDTDIAEASMRMQQLSLNYQALLSNITKVSKLSLVNYL